MKPRSKRFYIVLSVVAALVTMTLKFIGYFLTGSVGLFSDAAESVVNLNASKMIMRPDRVTEERHAPYLEQTDCRYDEGPLREFYPAPENAAPHPRGAVRKCSGDDYESRLVERCARAIRCGWHQDHRQAYAPDTTGP